MKKRRLKNGIRTAAFLCAFALLLALSSWALEPRDNTAAGGTARPETYGFCTLPQRTVDIAIIGNSNAFNGFSPMELWGKYGFSAYVSGEPWQQAESAVILLRQYFARQSPQLVILETDEVFTGNNSHAAVLATKAGERVPVFRYHNNWKKFRLSSLARGMHYSYHSVAMGEFIQTTAREYNGPADYMDASAGSREIPREARRSLDTFVQLCREHDAQLLLVSVPCATSWTNARHAAIQAYADQQGLPYLDLNLRTQEVGIDWSADTADGGTHLNLKGAEKVTDYLGKYLTEQYHPRDHRGDSSYALWQEDYQSFKSNYPA